LFGSALRKTRGLDFWSLIVGLALLYACLHAGEIQSDTLFHIKTGEWIALHKAIPRTDVFSWTVSGFPWVAHEWLWDLLAYLLYGALGKWGTFLLTSAGVTMYGLTLWGLLKRRSPLPVAAIIFISALASLDYIWCARPHVVAQGFFALTMYILFTAEEKPSRLWLLPAIALAWVNVHSSAPLGVLLAAGVFASSWVGLGPLSKTTCRKFAVIPLATAGASLINPYGPAIWKYALFVSTHGEFTKYIDEWLSPNFQNAGMLLGLFLMVALVGAAGMKKNKDFLLEGVLAAVTCAAWLYSVRHMPYFAFCGSLLAGSVAGSFLQKEDLRLISKCVPVLLLAGTLLLNASVIPVAWAKSDYISRLFPVKAVDYMQEHGLTKSVFNFYYWGGYLIFRNVPVFVDGRADVYEMSGKPVFRDTLDAFNARETKKAADPTDILDKWGARAVLVPPGYVINVILEQNKEWKEVYRDEAAVVYKRVD